MAGGIEYLQRKANAGDPTARAELQNMVKPSNQTIWKGFAALNRARAIVVGGAGVAPQPIQISEIAAYCEMHKIRDRARFQNAVLAMDQAYLEFESS